ncbi:MAG: hypothetical protein L0Y73_02195, partial [Candidatus Aminicenantes bacterium]|nr:hypothetical protein [Candidatus Aminicenantes bacterium]
LKDIPWVGLLTISAPKIIINLMKSGKYIKKALQKRKMIKAKTVCRPGGPGESIIKNVVNKNKEEK